MSSPRRYAAFISYSHRDERWAAWLQRALEGYRVPRRLAGGSAAHGRVPPRLAPVFRDRDELSSSGDLGARIRAALEASDALIVVCSPEAAASRWVNEEIAAFRQLGRGERIHCLLVAGEPHGQDGQDCFPAALESALPGHEDAAREYVAADARPGRDGKTLALLKLKAGLLGVGLDDLRQREAQRRTRRLAWVAAASFAGMALAIALAMSARIARDDAQRRQAQAEQLMGFMLGDLRGKLQTLGRLDLLDDVGDQALAYFRTLRPRDLSDTALSQQAQALTQIGQVRLEQGRHADALSAFTEAQARAAELSARAPDDGARRYDLAQAQFWIGQVAWTQGDLATADTWLQRYRDSTLVLAAMDPGNFDWQREVAYGHHNLAVLLDRRGRSAEAEQGIREELALYRRWLPGHPDDTTLINEAANAASWLASITERQGRLDEARALYTEADQGHARCQALEPTLRAWDAARIDTLLLLGRLQAMTGHIDEARVALELARDLGEQLVAHDPGNQEWRKSRANAVLSLAVLEADARPSVAAAAAAREGDGLRALLQDQPKDEFALSYYAKALKLCADIALRTADPDTARACLEEARRRLDPAWRERPTELIRTHLAETALLEARLALASGDADGARADHERALALLTDDGADPLPFGRLDAYVRAQLALGREADAAPARERLRAAGFVPSPPWPAPQAASADGPAPNRSPP